LKPTIVTTLSSAADEASAVEETLRQLQEGLGSAAPVGGLLFSGTDHRPERLQHLFAERLGQLQLLGMSGARAVATPAGVARGRALAGLWLAGDGVRWGTACADASPGPARAAGVAIEAALERGGLRAFDARLGIAHFTGGYEGLSEAVAERLVRARTIGGIASGAVWSCEEMLSGGVGVAVCDWPWRMASAIRSPFVPMERLGRISASRGCEILELDGVPAAEAYGRLLRMPSQVLAGAPGVRQLRPVGIARGQEHGAEAFAVHTPIVNHRAGSLIVTGEAQQGEELFLMGALDEKLATQGADAARQALERDGLSSERIAGALLLCAAPAQVDPALIAARFSESLSGRPFVAAFSGAQLGCLAPGRLELLDESAHALLLSGETEPGGRR
jgi:hypothetical protein